MSHPDGATAFAVDTGDGIDIFEDRAQTVMLCTFRADHPTKPNERTAGIVVNGCLWPLVWLKTPELAS